MAYTNQNIPSNLHRAKHGAYYSNNEVSTQNYSLVYWLDKVLFQKYNKYKSKSTLKPQMFQNMVNYTPLTK